MFAAEPVMQSMNSISNFHHHFVHFSSSGSSISDVELESLPKSEESEDTVFPDGEHSSMTPLSEMTTNSFDSAVQHDSSAHCWMPDTSPNPSNIPVTPSRSAVDTGGSPWTPTANLKLLLKAVSPDIRFKDKQEAMEKSRKTLTERLLRRNERMVEESGLDQLENTIEKNEHMISRKEKSLGLLCQRFLKKYPSMPPLDSKIEISLDEAADFLGVGRRRVYDIINVLEAMELASRLAKNKYLWHGKTNLKETLQKLKAAALSEGLDKQIENLKQLESCRESEGIKFPKSKSMPEPNQTPSELGSSPSLGWPNADGIKKSLNSLSQKFLMMFLVAQPQILNLDLCARVLISDAIVDHSDLGKFKTTIRRLYDIANIMTSLDLIQKVQITETRGRKPAFRYIGPKIDNVIGISHDGVLITKQGRKTASAKRSLAKHLSFENLCEAAEVAHNGNSSRKDAIKFKKLTSRTNSNQSVNFADSSIESEECGTEGSTVGSSLSSALKESKRIASHSVTTPVDALQPDKEVKEPVVLMIPDSKSRIRIFRTRSDSAIRQPSSVSSKLVRKCMGEIGEEEDFDIKQVSKKGRYDTALETDCPDTGGKNKSGQQVAYVKLVLRHNSCVQVSPPLLNSDPVENSLEATSLGLSEKSENNSRGSSNSFSEKVLDCSKSEALGLAVSSENDYLSDPANVLLRSRQILALVGKENAVNPNYEYSVRSGDHGIGMQKQILGFHKTPNISLRRISSFNSMPTAPKLYFGMPLSSNIANMTQSLGPHSSSNIATMNKPISSASKLATMQHPLVFSATGRCSVDAKTPGAVQPDGLGKMSPAPRVIYFRKLPSAGAAESSNPFHVFPSFKTSSPQPFNLPVHSGKFQSSTLSSSFEGHS